METQHLLMSIGFRPHTSIAWKGLLRKSTKEHAISNYVNFLFAFGPILISDFIERWNWKMHFFKPFIQCISHPFQLNREVFQLCLDSFASYPLWHTGANSDICGRICSNPPLIIRASQLMWLIQSSYIDHHCKRNIIIIIAIYFCSGIFLFQI